MRKPKEIPVTLTSRYNAVVYVILNLIRHLEYHRDSHRFHLYDTLRILSVNIPFLRKNI